MFRRQIEVRVAVAATLCILASCASYNGRDYFELYGPSDPANRRITSISPQHISYARQVKPILDGRCVSCHACYDAPCQVKLSSYDGLERGATKQPVYERARLFAATPTRLFTDARTTDEWRHKGFFPILNERERSPIAEIDNSLLAQLILQKRRYPLATQGTLDSQYNFDVERKNECPSMDAYAEFSYKHPQWGMPYALPGLTLGEEQTVLAWIEQGASNDQKFHTSDDARGNIADWEAFFNRTSLKQQLVSRYIYEHLFIGHLHFEGDADDAFYQLVRSKTASGTDIHEINTDRPYDDPGSEPFYYRLRRVHSTIVDKTHFIYELSDGRRQRYEELFFANDYDVASLPSYAPESGGNPIKTFADIPDLAKYRFMLDDAKYFASGFIKGPVCNGQLALNVIQDRFWVLFLDPDQVHAGDIKQHFSEHDNLLYLPGKEGDQIGFLGWDTYRRLGDSYLRIKSKFIDDVYKDQAAFSMASIWDGGGTNKNAALTIFRHEDSATVEQGLIGTTPKTAWVLDYFLFERIHYLLVAGFNVFGSTQHHVASRVYMDFLRRDGEYGLLRFFPSKAREGIYNDWYKGLVDGRLDDELLNLGVPTSVKYAGVSYKEEFFEQARAHLGDALAPSRWPQAVDHVHQTMRSLEELGGKSVAAMPEISFLRVSAKTGEDRVYTVLHNKALSNVAHIFAEDYRRVRSEEALTVIPGFLGSYPNFFFYIEEEQVDLFVDALKAATTTASKAEFYEHFGVRRSNPAFWDTFDWFNAQHKIWRGMEAGIFDLNRYQNL